MRNTAAVMLLFAAVGGGAAFSADPAATTPAATTPAATTTPAAVAPAGAIQIVQPYNKAVVRESVPVRLRDFPDGGYVSVSIDGQFITAQALPRNRTAPVYVWDTKASYADPDNPDTPKYYSDGAHAITIAVYDTQNKLVGQDSVSVQVADKINLPASQGIRLVYPWKTGLTLRYQRRTTLTAISTDSTAGAPPQVLQQSLLRFGRSVENVEAGSSLIRDEVIPVDRSVHPQAFVSYVATHGQSAALTSDIHARYREVDDRGRVQSLLTSQNTGDSIGFSIPVLPPRRVSVGAHWESPVQITLDWTAPNPATVEATSTLVDFEWQDRYPTAKIRETYEGPIVFNPGPGSAVPSITNQDIKYERIVYFAYNAGRVVRTQTTLTLVSNQPGLLNAAPGSTGMPGGYPGGMPGGGPGGYPGGFGGGRGGPNRPRPGFPVGTPVPGGTPGPGGYPGPDGPGAPGPDMSGGMQGGMPGGYPGGVPGGGPGGGYPGGPGGYPGGPGGYMGGPSQQIDTGGPIKLTYTETAVLLT